MSRAAFIQMTGVACSVARRLTIRLQTHRMKTAGGQSPRPKVSTIPVLSWSLILGASRRSGICVAFSSACYKPSASENVRYERR